jgi:uncharacterized protein YwqG
MGLFDRLFRKKPSSKGHANGQGSIRISKEEFMRSPFILDRLARFRRSTMALRPYRSDSADIGQSHFGGVPNMAGLQVHPECPHCARPLGFVLQVYRRDVPNAYFPEGTDLFQLFRCTNEACEADYHHYDQVTLAFFTHAGTSTMELPGSKGSTNDPVVASCAISPKAMDDLPNYDDYPEDEPGIAEKFGDELDEYFTDEHGPVTATKFGGWPSFTQSPLYPMCSCGQVKEFFFQLSSEDGIQVDGQPEAEGWSPHGLMMGDVGNIYFFVCKTCGPSSIESYFDCC